MSATIQTAEAERPWGDTDDAIRAWAKREGLQVIPVATAYSPNGVKLTRTTDGRETFSVWGPTLSEAAVKADRQMAHERRAKRFRPEALDFGFTGPGVSKK